MSKFSVGDRVNVVGIEPEVNPGTVVSLGPRSNLVAVLWDQDAEFSGAEALLHSESRLYLLAPAETLESLSFAAQVDSLLHEVGDMLKSKNAAYGDAALTPLRVFSRLDNAAGIRVRLDDKLSRIARGDGSGDEDAVLDLMGYVILLRIAESGK